MLRRPDDPGAIDDHVVGAVPRPVWKDEVFLLPCTRVQSDQAVRIPAIREPHIASVVEAHILPDPTSAAERTRELQELGIIDALSLWIRRQVVLNEHGLPKLRLVQRHLLFDADPTRLGARSEVLGHIVKQRFTIF